MKKHNSFGYALAALGVTLLGLIIAFVLITLLGSGYETLGGDSSELVDRTTEVLGVAEDSEVLNKKIKLGLMSPGDYIVSAMTGADYLLAGKTDDEFASDISYIVYGTRDDSAKIESIKADLTSKSRKFVLNKLLTDIDPEYAISTGTPDEAGSRIVNCEITKPLRGDKGYTIGIRQVEGNFIVTGEDVRTDFYVDGVLYQATIKHDEEDATKFTVSWDTAGVTEGLHDVRILLRSSDGRGYVAEGGEVLIPHCLEIVDNGISMGGISQGKEDSWYALYVDNKDCYVNFVDLSEDIAVGLYDIYGNLIGENDMPDSDYEVLRGKAQDIPAIEEKTGIQGLRSVYYVLVSRVPDENGTLDTSESISYKMVQTPNVAKYDGSYYAVKNNDMPLPTPMPLDGFEEDFNSKPITLVDLSGNEIEMTVGDVSILPINGFLEDMTLTDFGTQSAVNFFPVFGKEDLYYGFYCNNNVGSVAVDATALEGYAAQISVSNNSGFGTNTVELGQSIPLVPGENEIDIDVTSFMGNTKTYKIFILNGDDNDGFSTSTLAKFPTSYYSGLWLLHSLHPKYVFKPYNTGLDYNNVMENEDNRDRNLANMNSHPGWVVESSPVYDGGGWKQARSSVVSYFVDPRNFLDPKSVFQFESLSFNESAQTVDGVRSMVKGSFLDDPSIDYAQIIYDAGKTANMSPYFLASRILQEMGYQGESLLCHGTLPGYEGYYNFYNIGSTPDPSVENGALINGAKYAMWGKDAASKTITEEEEALMLPWDSVEKAITGGALWMASRYTAVGQDTLYFQKFDVIDNEDGLYEHQYAQNVSMAYSEGRRYFSSYASVGMVDESFIFVIPVYANLPSSFGVMPEA